MQIGESVVPVFIKSRFSCQRDQLLVTMALQVTVVKQRVKRRIKSGTCFHPLPCLR